MCQQIGTNMYISFYYRYYLFKVISELVWISKDSYKNMRWGACNATNRRISAMQWFDFLLSQECNYNGRSTVPIFAYLTLISERFLSHLTRTSSIQSEMFVYFFADLRSSLNQRLKSQRVWQTGSLWTRPNPTPELVVTCVLPALLRHLVPLVHICFIRHHFTIGVTDHFDSFCPWNSIR